MSDSIREVALRKDGQTYVFRTDGASRAALLAVLRRFVGNPDLNFSWHDAAVVCQKSRKPCEPSVHSPRLPQRLR